MLIGRWLEERTGDELFAFRIVFNRWCYFGILTPHWWVPALISRQALNSRAKQHYRLNSKSETAPQDCSTLQRRQGHFSIVIIRGVICSTERAKSSDLVRSLNLSREDNSFQLDLSIELIIQCCKRTSFYKITTYNTPKKSLTNQFANKT